MRKTMQNIQQRWQMYLLKRAQGRACMLPRRASSRKTQGILCASLGFGLLVAVVLTLQVQQMMAFAETCAEIRSDTLRLHIQANSNSVADQTVKLQVRDAVLAVMDEVYQDALAAKETQQAASQTNCATGTLTQAESIALVMQNMPRFALAAREVLAAAGVQQTVQIYLTEMYFDTTVYDTFTLPAGEYTALRIELGQASGKNWWCVLYPSFCLASASGGYETEAEDAIVCGDYAIRFAAVEWWEQRSAAMAAGK